MRSSTPEREGDRPAASSVAQATARLRAEHRQETSAAQHKTDRVTAWVGSPSFVATLTGLILAWMTGNIVWGFLGGAPVDPPPFFWLQGAISMISLYVVALVLSTSRREDRLATTREQLNLELAILNDQKIAKIIALLEESRIDNPAIPDRVDPEAQDMAKPSDPHEVLAAIKDVEGQSQ